MPTIRAVFDASVLLRALLAGADDARAWVRGVEARQVTASVPELLFAECVHVARRAVRSGAFAQADAAVVVDRVGRLPLRVHPNRDLATAALPRALVSGISGYDAFYVVLAEALDATLVTADRRLTKAYPRIQLVD
jgi:predicted nucleic acid-binding protein